MAGILSFCHLIAPDAFTLERSLQDGHDEEQRLSPFEFLQRVLENGHWPVHEARVAHMLTKIVVNRGCLCLIEQATRDKVLSFFREMGKTKNADYDADILHQHFPDRQEPIDNSNNSNLGWLNDSSDDSEDDSDYPPNRRGSRRKGATKSISK